MMVNHVSHLMSKEVNSPEAFNTAMKVLVSPKEGWTGYVMRAVEVKEEGYTPKHSHPWPHINYMIEGEGELMINGEINKVTSGSYAFVPSDALHQFRNAGKGTFKFICIVPEEGHIY
ncbi:MAG: cupin domain-containing protein [Bacillota bacterium]